MATLNADIDQLVGHREEQIWAGSFGALRSGGGTSAVLGDFSGAPATVGSAIVGSGAGSNNWYQLERFAFSFDTSGIGSGQVINSATVTIGGWSAVPFNSFSYSDFTVDLFDYSGSTTSANAGDFGSYSSSSLTGTPAAFNAGLPIVFTLNGSGIAAINPVGRTYMGIREGKYDAGGSTPAWEDSKGMQVANHNGNGYISISIDYSPAPVSSDVLFRMA